ncbi:UDP-glucose dehydrogenase family protein [Chloroflexota bacterium]
MKISVIGAGYVGLTIATCLAKLGNEIVLIDIDEEKLEAIRNNRISPIYEEGLDELLNQVHIEVSSDYQKILPSDTIFICVGTPSEESGSIFQEHITETTKQIAEILKTKQDYCVVAVKSTVAPGTTEELVIPILETSGRKAGDDFGICMCPEFLREGKAINDFMNPARVIIGEYDGKSGDMIYSLYQSFNAPTLRTSLRTAEMIKLASNAFLATKISFINEVGNICKQLGIDTYEIAKGMGFDDRIGCKFLNPGIGFGGSCLPKDLKMLIARAREIGYEPTILQGVLNFNDEQALKFVGLLKKHVPLKNAVIGLLGLAFKPETDDVRDSRAIGIVEVLLREGAVVKAYDPLAAKNFSQLFPQIDYVTKEEVLNSDAILIVTEWEEFNNLNYKGKIVIDGRRVATAREARIYEGVCW